MAYRNGTYVAFHAQGTNRPGESDMDYYNLMKAWTAKTDDDFAMFNSHEKASAVRDSSKRATLEASLRLRLRNSKNFVLIIGPTTRLDTDWVPFEIRNAIDTYELPIIAAYTGYERICDPAALSALWPTALSFRIRNKTARVIHIPFKKQPLKLAISTYSHEELPKGPLGYYTRETYRSWGITA
jgi:Thoeris protein ThsB, TIR-like domain